MPATKAKTPVRTKKTPQPKKTKTAKEVKAPAPAPEPAEAEPEAEAIVPAPAAEPVAEQKPAKSSDIRVISQSRYYEDFLVWLHCCREFDSEQIIGTPLEINLFKAFKSIMTTIRMLLDDPEQIIGVDFKKGLQIRYRSAMKWKYPNGDVLIYHPDQVIETMRNYHIDD